MPWKLFLSAVDTPLSELESLDSIDCCPSLPTTTPARYSGGQIDTLVTDLLLLGDDSEYAGSFSSEARNEFLFQLFHLIFIGGAMHQRDEDCLG